MLRYKEYIFLLISFGFIVSTIMPISVLSQLSEKNLETHIHVHLRMVKDGRNIIIPAHIGIDPSLSFNHSFNRYSGQPKAFSALHTHATDGIIHVESTVFRRFTLADFLSVWGLDQSKIAYVNMTSGGKDLKLSDYKTRPLQDNESLTIVMKTEKYPPSFTHFVNSTNGLAFDYPSNWNISQSSSQPPSGVIYSLHLFPKEASFLHTPLLIPNLSIEIAKLPSSNMTLDQYTIRELPLLLKPKIENRSYHIIDVPTVIKNKPFDFNGSPARNITFTTDEDDITTGVHVIQQNIQILSINKDKAYTISYSGIVSPNTTSYMYDDYLQAAEKIIRSIKLP